MTLFIDVQGVPNAILELVKARILTNRKRSKERRLAAPKPEQQQPARRRYYSPLAPDRRPEPAGIPLGNGKTGLAWLLLPNLPGYFNAAFSWRNEITEEKIISETDTFTFKVGSGDGSTWVTATVNLPGINAWRESLDNAFQPAVIGPGPHPADPNGKYFDGGRQIIDDTRINTIALPCGNGAAIVLVTIRAAGSFGGWGSKATNTFQAGSDWFVSEPYSNETISSLSVSASASAAFVVSQTGCRQISLPDALQSALNILSPPTVWGDDYVWYAPLSVTVQKPTATNVYWYTGGDTPRRMFDDAVFLPLYVNYGADDQLMEYDEPGYQFGLATFTPAVFTILNKYSELFPALPFATGLDLGFGYAAGRDTLISYGSPAPTHVVGIDARLDDFGAISSAIYNNVAGYNEGNAQRKLYRDPNSYLSGLSVVRNNIQPTAYGDQIPQVSSWQNLKRLRFVVQRPDVEATAADGYGTLWHYDWGKPEYCREQLQLLGFTSADLTP